MISTLSNKEDEHTSIKLISIILTTRNEIRTIRQCIESLLQQSYPRFEIIIVDALSDDGTPQIIEEMKIRATKFSNCRRFVAQTTRAETPAKGRNIGVSLANGDLLAFTDGDCIADRQWLHKLIVNIRKGMNFVGGPNIIVHPHKSTMTQAIDEVLRTYVGGGQSLQFRQQKRKTPVSGAIPACNIGITKELFWKLKGFNESLRFNEDTDFCQRARKLGESILYVPDAVVFHHMQVDSFSDLGKFVVKYGFERGKNIPRIPRLLSRFYGISASLFLTLIVLIISALIVPSLRLPVVLILIATTIPLIILSIQVYRKTSNLTSGLVTPLLIVMIFIVYNFVLLCGIASGFTRTRVPNQ